MIGFYLADSELDVLIFEFVSYQINKKLCLSYFVKHYNWIEYQIIQNNELVTRNFLIKAANKNFELKRMFLHALI